MIWQLQQAKSQLGELIQKVSIEGPQIITRRGEEVAVVISRQEYSRLLSKKQKLSSFFRSSPFVDAELDLSRDRDGSTREMDL